MIIHIIFLHDIQYFIYQHVYAVLKIIKIPKCFYIFPVQFSSVTQLCPTLRNPMNRRTPGLPVHHQLPEFIQTHVHRVGDDIQPSHPLSSPSPSTPNPPSIRVFSNESTPRMRWPKYWSFSFSISPSNEHPGLIFSMEWLAMSFGILTSSPQLVPLSFPVCAISVFSDTWNITEDTS